MSFGGHILDMIKRTNANNALRKKHRSKKNKMADTLRKSNVNYDTLKEEKICEEKLERIKSSIRHKLRKERQKEVILTGCIFILCLLLLYIALYFFFKN